MKKDLTLLETNLKKALFITFDETLVTTLSGRKYSLHGEDWKFINSAVELIKLYINKGYVICIICNQDAIKQGFISEKTFLRKINLVVKTLERDLKLKENTITYSYSIDKDSYRHLPNPGMIYELALEYELDIINSTLVYKYSEELEICKSTGIQNFISYLNVNNNKNENY